MLTPLQMKGILCLYIPSTYRSIPTICRAKFAMITGVIETFAIFCLYHIGHFLKKVVARLTEHDDVIKHCSGGPRTVFVKQKTKRKE